MSAFNCKTNSNWPNQNLTIAEYSDFVDLQLVTATAYETVPPYPVHFGKEPSPRIIMVDKEFSVLTNWEGNVLIKGF